MRHRMKNDQTTRKPIRLANYTPPAYRIETVDLRYDLDPITTRATNTMRVRRNAAEPGDPMILNGERLDLISVTLDANELSPGAYRIDDGALTVPRVPETFELTVVTETHPKDNTALEGLYQSSGNFCSQCEAEGFRRITYFLDRPDVMATYSTTVAADKTNYPVLLSNGNPVDAGDLDNGLDPKPPEKDAQAYRGVLNSETLDDAFKAEALTLPSAKAIGDDLENIDPDKLVEARDALVKHLAEALDPDLKRGYGLHANDTEYTLDAAAFGRRRLKNLCLAYLGWLERNEYIQLAIDQINVERNMTDVIAGLRVLSHLDIPEREQEFTAFNEKWKDDPLVTDKWLALQATAKRENVIEDLKALMEHPAFNRRNRNRIRSLIGAFAMGNFEGFDRADSERYRLLADFVIELYPLNPQIGSSLVRAIIRWRRFDAAKQESINNELRRLISTTSLSANTSEIVWRALT